MADRSETPRPHGDPLEDVVDSNPEENRAQRDSDASPADVMEGDTPSDRAGGRGSDANGGPAFGDADGETRKKLYRDGASIVSRMD